MAISNIENVNIEAIAACVPKTVINNYEFGKELYGDKLNSLINSTGMVQRHVCGDESITTLDLCVKSANALFESFSISPDKIGAIVFVTLTPDSLMPNNASSAQALLKIPGNIPCFDINHACSGYIYGLWVSSLVARSIGKRVLLLDGDTNSLYVSPLDKSTAILFGDAGTATILNPEGNFSKWAFDFKTDGSLRKFLQIPGLGFREKISHGSLEYQKYADGSQRRRIDMEMDGAVVFNYVVSDVYQYLRAFMDEIETVPQDYAYAVFHQANAFMLRQLARKLGFAPSQVPMSMGKYGNTSSASIPLNICSELRNQLGSSDSKRLLLSGFGAGFAYGAVDLEISNLKSFDIIEY